MNPIDELLIVMLDNPAMPLPLILRVSDLLLQRGTAMDNKKLHDRVRQRLEGMLFTEAMQPKDKLDIIQFLHEKVQ